MAVVHTESEKESSSKYVKKTTIRLKIKCRIEEVGTGWALRSIRFVFVIRVAHAFSVRDAD
jgi:hypothetical protein